MQDDFDICLVLNTRMAARAITRVADRRMKPFGVTAAQFNILGTLGQRPGRSISEMAQSLAMERTTLSRNLALLERKGLVSGTMAANGRAHLYEITPFGRSTFERALPEWRLSVDELRVALRDPGYDTILSGLRAISHL